MSRVSCSSVVVSLMYAMCRCFGPGVLNQLVNLNCVPLIPDGDAKRHKVYTGSGNSCPTSSLGD